MEIKSASGKSIAIVVKKNSLKKKGVKFISQEEFPLQLGISFYQTGNEIKPHQHLSRKITINEIQEIIYLEFGKVKVDLYDENEERFKSLKLGAGDIIFFTGQGGHGFDILEESKFIEVKQGPYLGKDLDKKILLQAK